MCELISSEIAEKLGIEYTKYNIFWENNKLFLVCEDFITSDTELVSAYNIMKNIKNPNDVSVYEFYIQCVEKLNIKDIRRRLEKIIVRDCLICNEDRHFNNFGFVRNAVILKWLYLIAEHLFGIIHRKF